MPAQIVFYQLGAKFLEQAQNVPAPSNQLIHYTLALGHHIGVIDCFSAKLEVPYDKYAAWIAHLPDGIGRRKLERTLRFGEIEIDPEHARPLLQALKAARAEMSAEEIEWTDSLNGMLQDIAEEPALYLMVRQR